MDSVLLVMACLLGSAFFSGSETALLRLRLSDLEAPEVESEPVAPAARALLQSTSRLLVTILFGNNVANILGAAAATAIAIAALGPELGVVVATVVMTVTVLIFCEVVPKALAAAHPLGVSRVVAIPLYLFHQLMWPIHQIFSRAVDPLVLRITGRDGDDARLGAEDLLRLARQTPAEPGAAPASIIGATARAAEMTVEEIMVGRTEIVALPLTLSAQELLEGMLQERYTRVPVYEESIDRLAGVLHLKDVVRLVHSGGGDVRGILRPVLRVPERKPILSLLAEMQRAFAHLAVVKDEHGVTRGLVTAEDILEELVGEIRDEHDREELQSIQSRGDAYEAFGRVKVLDFSRATGWELPSERGDTLSGLVFNRLGRAPHRGDRVELDGHELEVLEVSGTRIARVSVRRREAAEEEDAADG